MKRTGSSGRVRTLHSLPPPSGGILHSDPSSLSGYDPATSPRTHDKNRPAHRKYPIRSSAGELREDADGALRRGQLAAERAGRCRRYLDGNYADGTAIDMWEALGRSCKFTRWV